MGVQGSMRKELLCGVEEEVGELKIVQAELEG